MDGFPFNTSPPGFRSADPYTGSPKEVYPRSRFADGLVDFLFSGHATGKFNPPPPFFFLRAFPQT